MLLALDIGNTYIKSAMFDDEQLESYNVHSNFEDVNEYIHKSYFKSAAICSVNPSKQKVLSEILSSKDVSIFKVSINQKFNLQIIYATQETLGMDRVCSAVSALKLAEEQSLTKNNQYLITIDFGTATTVNIVSPKKEFIGGLIAPGVRTMLNSLKTNTAQLPSLEINDYKGLIGNSTNSSIISGVVNSTIGMINEVVKKIKEVSKITPLIFATGGNSKFILPQIKHEVFFEEALVLKGLKHIYDLNN